jgi:hypothetical protein
MEREGKNRGENWEKRRELIGSFELGLGGDK